MTPGDILLRLLENAGRDLTPEEVRNLWQRDYGR
jgi:hypothetical protein